MTKVIVSQKMSVKCQKCKSFYYKVKKDGHKEYKRCKCHEDWKEDYWVDTIVILNLIPIILATISLLHRN